MTSSGESQKPFVHEKKEEYKSVVTIPAEVIVDAPGVVPPAPSDLQLEWVDEAWLGHRACVIHHLFSPSECQAMIDFCEGRSPAAAAILNASGGEGDGVAKEPGQVGLMVPAHSRQDYRNNLRVVAMGPEIADLLFKRMQPILDDPNSGINEGTIHIDASNATKYEEAGVGIQGTWTMSRINPCFRICKYNPDGHFGPHYDSEYLESYQSRSLKTFMIYLNDEYEDGTTNFVEEHAMHYDEATKRYKSPPEAVKAKLKARTGDCLIFDHLLLHEGDTVRNGVKYIMRAEVMYQRAPPQTEEEKRYERGYLLLHEGKRLEAENRLDEAVAKYRAAFKVAPELEATA